MSPAEFFALVASLSHGKRLPTATYLVDLDSEHLPWDLRQICGELRTRICIGIEFNLLKFHTDRPKISFLSYPGFFDDPHPPLAAAIVVDLVTGKVRRDDYRTRSNPPILHRKEAFLPLAHPDRERFAVLTKAEEHAGLLEETDRIGFKLNWERILAEKSLSFAGHRLVTQLAVSPPPHSEGCHRTRIERHRTALARTQVSKPVRLLLDLAQLRPAESFFDFGCGLGADVAAVRLLGFEATGWDPAHAADSPRTPADVVNLGFVINVVEDPAERVEVLLAAWKLARRLLVVSTLVRGQEDYAAFRCCGDGLLTSRNTFQKYFEPAEVQALLEDVLGTDALPVAMGIYFVFRRTEDAQDFLSARTRRFVDWEAISRRLGLYRALRAQRDPYEPHRELLNAFWEVVLALGRVPHEDEFGELAEVRRVCGSVPRAMALFSERFGDQTLEAARKRRRDDLLVYLAASRLRKHVPFSKLSTGLQRNIRNFFGSYAEAEHRAIELMFAAGDVDEIELAVQQPGIGWFDPVERHFTVHRSMLGELPSILRVFVECGARLFGDPREADLIKFHLRSRKLTFQHYENFESDPFPRLLLRIKIDLPRMFVTVFDHAAGSDRQFLYFKERFLPVTFPGHDRMTHISHRLRRLGFDEKTIGFGPTETELKRLLAERNLTCALTRRRRTGDSRPVKPGDTG